MVPVSIFTFHQIELHLKLNNYRLRIRFLLFKKNEKKKTKNHTVETDLKIPHCRNKI
jgi:hypothetical protein